MIPALTLFVPQIATSIYNILDKSMIGLITGNDAEVAYYEQAQKIIKDDSCNSFCSWYSYAAPCS